MLFTFGKEPRSLPSPLATNPVEIMGAGIYPLLDHRISVDRLEIYKPDRRVSFTRPRRRRSRARP